MNAIWIEKQGRIYIRYIFKWQKHGNAKVNSTFKSQDYKSARHRLHAEAFFSYLGPG
jgi:hypothetical protein